MLYENVVTVHYARLTSEIFVIAIKLAAPVLTILILVEILFGVLARTVPQMNIFIVAFPLKIGVGLIGLLITWPFFINLTRKMFAWFEIELQQMMILIGGG